MPSLECPDLVLMTRWSIVPNTALSWCRSTPDPRDCGKMWNWQASSKAAKPVGNVSDVPPHAWHTLGTNLFYWNKIDCLVIGNYFSKYLIVRKLPNSSTHAMIKELGLIFTELGRPFILRSDYGPCYSSREFHNFLSFYQVNHVTSSPHYPQSNGFALNVSDAPLTELFSEFTT